MQNKFRVWMGSVTAIAALCLMMASCKKTFNDPPYLTNPGVVANTSIKALKARYGALGNPIAITDSVVISGIVNCDDKSGNYYQQISIQDSTGGILLRLAGSNLYTSYPVGRQIFVKCKGLYLGDYGGMIQLGGGIDSVSNPNRNGVTLLSANLQDQYIIKGALNQPLVPKVVTISQLTTSVQDPYLATLIKLQNMQFNSGELSKGIYATAADQNRIVEACTSPSSNKITLRSSSYAKFAVDSLPRGNGDIVGIYSIFTSTKQLTIRDTTDVNFTNPRCGGSGASGSITLGTSPLTINFDNLASGLPTGVYVKQDATPTSLGTDGTVYNGSFNNKTAWNQTSLGFKNFASATGLNSTSTSTDQDNSTNRALGVRQTSAVSSGGDPGASFAFLLTNTTGKTNLKLNFLLQSLDAPATAGRTTTWKVDYGVGASPSSFITVATNPSTLTTTLGNFTNTPVTVNFGNTLDNINQPIWIRVSTFTQTSGGGSRPSSAIDDVKFTWN